MRRHDSSLTLARCPEAKVEDKDLKAANDDLAAAQKAEDKYLKQIHDATKEYNKDKAHNDKAALELEKAQKRYSASAAKLQEAEREVESRKAEHERLKARTKECHQRIAEQRDMVRRGVVWRRRRGVGQ